MGFHCGVLDSNRGYEGHQKVHTAEAVQEQVVTEAPADDNEPFAPAPTLPSQAKVKKTAKVVPTQGTAAGKAAPSSSKKQAKGKEKELHTPGKSDDDDAEKKEEEEDPEQVLETQQKRKRATAAHFDASPDSGKGQPKKKAKTAVTASAESSRPRVLVPSRLPVPLPHQVGQVRWQETLVPGCLRLQDRRRSKSPLTHVFCLFLQSCVREASRTCLRRECNYMPLRASTFLPSFYFSVCTLCTLCLVFVVFRTQLFP